MNNSADQPDLTDASQALVAKGPLLYRWNDLVLSFSDAAQLRPHTHQAAELVVALDQPLSSKVAGQSIVAHSLLIPPGIEHQNSHTDVVSAVFYLDVESYRFERLAEHMQLVGPVFVGATEESMLRRALTGVYLGRPSAHECYSQVVEPFLSDGTRPIGTLDARVAAVITMLKANPAQEQTVAQLAHQVGLSGDRLHHLFREALGIPLHRYRIWLRLNLASQSHRAGANLTEAALDAGFSDAAHFSRTFSKMFGGKPSQLIDTGSEERVFYG